MSGTTEQPARAQGLDPGDVLEVVRQAVAVVLERDAAEITRETVLTDLGADSLALVEVAEIVEERLGAHRRGLHIPDDDLAGFRTVGDAVDYAVTRL